MIDGEQKVKKKVVVVGSGKRDLLGEHQMLLGKVPHNVTLWKMGDSQAAIMVCMFTNAVFTQLAQLVLTVVGCCC